MLFSGTEKEKGEAWPKNRRFLVCTYIYVWAGELRPLLNQMQNQECLFVLFFFFLQYTAIFVVPSVDV